MIKPPLLSTLTPSVNATVIATFMEEMAVQMVESADTLKTSAMAKVTGTHIHEAVEGMITRAGQIRVLADDMRASGELENFDEACALVGWRPTAQALQGFHAAH